jgi:hypothetical protein
MLCGLATAEKLSRPQTENTSWNAPPAPTFPRARPGLRAAAGFLKSGRTLNEPGHLPANIRDAITSVRR